jgi:hypothetical protein
MEREPGDVPLFDTPLLRDVASAFVVRRKAIRYQAGWSCGREFSEASGGTSERLNLDLRPGGGDLRVSVWGDGELWVRLCVAGPGRNAGWAFLDQFRGSVLDVSPAALVSMVEATIAGPFRPGVSEPASYRAWLRATWRRVQPRAE